MEANLYIKLLSHLRLNIAKKNLFFKILINNQELDMIRLLTQRGIVRRFFKLHTRLNTKNLYIVYPNHTLLSNSNLRVKLFNRNADHITLTLHALKLLNHASGTSSFVLKTNKGLLTHQEAIKYQLGGVLVCLIY